VPPPGRPPRAIASARRISSATDKVLAVVSTNAPDRNTPFSPPDEDSRRIAGHILDFLAHEVAKGRLPANLLPLQSGVGNIANAVLHGLDQGAFEGLTSYTEVIQDGMIELINSGKLTVASATAFSLSPATVDRINDHMDDYRKSIILRPQEISNHPEIIRRLGCLAMNGMIEADIYGNVNSTHLMGTRIQNGIGGSGDFACNAFISFFMTPSTAKRGAISCIVPMASHVDHSEHDVHVVVTEQGPRRPARAVAEATGHPDHRALRPPRLPAGSAGVGPPRARCLPRQADAARPRGGALLARPLPAHRHHAGVTPRDRALSMFSSVGSGGSSGLGISNPRGPRHASRSWCRAGVRDGVVPGPRPD
jgi:succinyl-CoA:acetate CoA-transferase